MSSPDGSNYAFKLNSDGSVSPQNGGIVDFTVSYVNAGGGAINYASILANGGQFIIKTTGGDQITLRLFIPGNGTQYSVARPTQIIYRGGYTWNFVYGSQGEVQTINDSLGRTISIAWNYLVNTDGVGAAYPRSISMITLPDGTKLSYTYESPAGNQTDSQRFVRLKSFSRSTSTPTVVDSASYLYETLNAPSFLTGIIDNAGVRFATWQYDSQGRVVSAQHAGGADAVTVAYTSDFLHLYRTVTNALGKQTVYTFNSISGSEPLISGIVGTPSTNCAGTASSLTYDANNNISTTTDEAGNTTTFTYGSDGRLATKTEASGTALSRATTITWNNQFGVPTKIVAPNRTSDFVYDTAGRLLTRTDTDTTTYSLPYSTNGRTRVTTYTYNAQGLLATVDGPLPGTADTTQFAYTAKGYLNKVTDALGHITQVTTTDAAGRPTTIVDPNGVTTTVTYDGVGRLQTSVTVGITTTYTYDPVGNLVKAALTPEGSYLQYSYDSARRLTQVQDEAGNRVHYTVDADGNRTEIDVYDPSSTLKQMQTRVYDELDRLLKIQYPLGQQIVLSYDPLGNVKTQTNMGNLTTTNQFDALNRLFKVTDPGQGVTQYGYDPLDNLTSVTDPRGLMTSYVVDAFGNVIRTSSPDSGVTVSTYDAAGNLLTSKDAKAQTTSYQYDALYRRTMVTYAGGSTIKYTYDQGTNGIGRLTSMTDPSGSTTWTYDTLGHVTKKVQAIGASSLTTSYAYDAAGHLLTTTLPSTNKIGYTWTTRHITALTLNTSPLVSSIAYFPFGGPTSWSLANGETASRTYNLDGRISADPVETLSYDTGARISSWLLGNRSQLSSSHSFSYDALDRVTNYTGGASGTQSFGYDANGNRNSEVVNGTTTAFQVDAASNRALKVGAQVLSYDTNGSMTADGIGTYTYNSAGRLSSLTSRASGGLLAVTVNSTYDGFGERVSKQVGLTTTVFGYDAAGHLTGEYHATIGGAIEETVYLGDMPIALLQGGATYYIHSDYRNTPRQIDDVNKKAVWAWDSAPFGDSAPNPRPAGQLLAFTYNLRFPGQYIDPESGLFYNYQRDYDAPLGRYLESDPIGLKGGVNTYAYAYSNPLSWIDPRGLDPGAPGGTNGGPTTPGNTGQTGGGELGSYGPQNNPNYPGSPKPNLLKPDSSAGRYDICPASSLTGRICTNCVDFACNFNPGATAYCCQIDYRKCLGGAIDDPSTLAQCNAQLATCSMRSGR